jgi:pilus assembly protein CpaE
LENRVDVRDRTDPALGRAEVGLEAARAFTALDGGDEVSDYLGYGDAAGLLEVGSPFAESVAACLAQLLQELGSLPEAEPAQRAAQGLAPRRRGLFRRRREAV